MNQEEFFLGTLHLMIKPSQTFETSVTSYPATHRHFPRDLNSQPYRCENLKYDNSTLLSKI
jgi:hypothetical protein